MHRHGENSIAREENDDLVQLTRRATGGEQQAWNGLIERLFPLLKSVVMRYGLQGEDAEDVHQTVWLRLLENLPGVRDAQALPGWIATTARNECVNTIRRSGRSIPVESHPEDSAAEADSAVIYVEKLSRQERRRALLEAFSELPDLQRDLLFLLIREPPVSYSEISQQLDIPIGSIGPTRARVLARLRNSQPLLELQE